MPPDDYHSFHPVFADNDALLLSMIHVPKLRKISPQIKQNPLNIIVCNPLFKLSKTNTIY